MGQITADAVIELSEKYAKFALGYCIHGKPVIIYSDKKPMRGISGGRIVDPEAVRNSLIGFQHAGNGADGLDISVGTVSIVVPSIGLVTYEYERTFGVFSPDNVIGKSDIINIVSSFSKEEMPNHNEIVDIIPFRFILDDQKVFENPPLKQVSGRIVAKARFLTLPSKYHNEYRRVVESAGFRINRTMVSTYCACEMIKSEKTLGLPDSYFFVDYGAGMTMVGLVGHNVNFHSIFFQEGGETMAENVAAKCGINVEIAHRLLDKYGYDTREHSFQRPIYVENENGTNPIKVFQKDLNQAILESVSKLCSLIQSAINSLADKQRNKEFILPFPLVFSGGASQLHGLKEALEKCMGDKEIHFYVPTVAGGRDPGMTNILGCLVAQSEYHGSLQESGRAMTTLSRED